jgi:hypothetical protein
MSPESVSRSSIWSQNRPTLVLELLVLPDEIILMIIGFMQGDRGEALYTKPCRESENDLGRSTAAMLCREADRLELYFVHSDYYPNNMQITTKRMLTKYSRLIYRGSELARPLDYSFVVGKLR